jgi:hypothetical protein
MAGFGRSTPFPRRRGRTTRRCSRWRARRLPALDREVVGQAGRPARRLGSGVQVPKKCRQRSFHRADSGRLAVARLPSPGFKKASYVVACTNSSFLGVNDDAPCCFSPPQDLVGPWSDAHLPSEAGTGHQAERDPRHRGSPSRACHVRPVRLDRELAAILGLDALVDVHQPTVSDHSGCFGPHRIATPRGPPPLVGSMA